MRSNLKICGLIVCLLNIGTASAWMPVTDAYSKFMPIKELKERAAGGDEEAVLTVGIQKDSELIPALRKLAANCVLNDEQLMRRLHVKSLKEKNQQKYIHDHTEIAQREHRNSCFAAKAALTRMKDHDYLNDFVVELSTTNLWWKEDVINYLGYIGDVRAIKYLGPLLSDDSGPDTRGLPGIPVADEAAAAMGDIIQPDSIVNLRRYPGNRYGNLKEWRMWWKENQQNYH